MSFGSAEETINSHFLNGKCLLQAPATQFNYRSSHNLSEPCLKRPISRSSQKSLFFFLTRYQLISFVVRTVLTHIFQAEKYAIIQTLLLHRGSMPLSFKLRGTLPLTSRLLWYWSLLKHAAPFQPTFHSQRTDLCYPFYLWWFQCSVGPPWQ